MAVIRLLALCAGGYLFIIVTAVLVGGAVGHRPSLALLARVTPRTLRPLLAVATTATIAAGVTAAPRAEAAGGGDQAPTLRWVGPPPARVPAPKRPDISSRAPDTAPPATALPHTASPSTAAPRTGRAATPPSPAKLSAPGDGAGERRAPTTPVTAHGPERGGSATPGRRAPRPPESYVVRHGDDFWSIAAAQVRARSSGSVEPAQIARYWKLLVQANTATLPVPGQPNLLFAGDRITLPPVP